MTATQVLEAMSEDQILDFAGACADTARQMEVHLIRAAYQWAIVHPGIALDPDETTKPGRERARQWGGDGTPTVSEFAAAEFGARIGCSPHAAARLIGDALDLHHRHPHLWARVQAGEVRASYARHVTGKTRDLTVAEAAFVDAGVAESADGRLPWSRFETLVAAKITQAAPELAREKEERAAKARFAKQLRPTQVDEAHGMATFMIRADVATIEAINTAVTALAARIADARPDDPHLQTDDQRRVEAIVLMAAGNSTETGISVERLLPDVQMHVHFYAGPDAEPVARVEGHGPVTEAWVRETLGPKVRFRIQPVLDLAGQAPVDNYEIPDRHRQAVHLMTPADTFPYATCTTRSMQVDHTIPFDQGGATGVGNYGPLTIRHHRIKTFARWQVQQPFPGIYLWRDPHGVFYLVDHTGTRQLPNAPAIDIAYAA